MWCDTEGKLASARESNEYAVPLICDEIQEESE